MYLESRHQTLCFFNFEGMAGNGKRNDRILKHGVRGHLGREKKSRNKSFCFFPEFSALSVTQGCQMVYSKFQFGYILKALALENVGIFYGHLIHLRPSGIFAKAMGIFSCNLVYFPSFGMFYQEIWQPCCDEPTEAKKRIAETF
jgi:hypothetical protein